jgi:hypothetical protein
VWRKKIRTLDLSDRRPPRDGRVKKSTDESSALRADDVALIGQGGRFTAVETKQRFSAKIARPCVNSRGWDATASPDL